MKVFNDLNLVEQMGTGIIRILQSYDKSSFEFFPNFIRVTFPFKDNNFDKYNIVEDDKLELTEIQKQIVKLMLDMPNITQKELSRLIDVTVRTIERNVRTLILNGIIIRDGSKKTGKWKVIKKGSEK